MDSDDVFDIIETVAMTTETNVKVELLQTFASPELKAVLKAACNPLVTYGILPEETLSGNGVATFESNETEVLLKELAERQLTGLAAQNAVAIELEQLSYSSGKLLVRILRKDLRAGINKKLINKAFKGLIPEAPYMRCSTIKEVPLDTIDWSKGVYSQVKANGQFLNLTKLSSGEITLTTRQGQVFDNTVMREIVGPAADCLDPGYQYHGELLVWDRIGVVLDRPTGNGILNSVLSGSAFPAGMDPVFKVWDMVFVGNTGVVDDKLCYKDRLELLTRTLAPNPMIGIIDTETVHSKFEANVHLEYVTRRGEEGTVLKLKDGIWKNGTSRSQIKHKPVYTVSLRVIDLLAGKGKFKDTFGSLLCVSEDGGLSVGVSGLTDAKRMEIYTNADAWMGSIIDVNFKEVIKAKNKKEYSLFEPRFGGESPEKQEADELSEILKRYPIQKEK